MNWLSILSAVLAIARALSDWMRNRQLIDAGTDAAIVKGLRDADEAIDRAIKARELVRSEHERNPSSIMRDDEFKRSD